MALDCDAIAAEHAKALARLAAFDADCAVPRTSVKDGDESRDYNATRNSLCKVVESLAKQYADCVEKSGAPFIFVGTGGNFACTPEENGG